MNPKDNKRNITEEHFERPFPFFFLDKLLGAIFVGQKIRSVLIG